MYLRIIKAEEMVKNTIYLITLLLLNILSFSFLSNFVSGMNPYLFTITFFVFIVLLLVNIMMIIKTKRFKMKIILGTATIFLIIASGLLGFMVLESNSNEINVRRYYYDGKINIDK